MPVTPEQVWQALRKSSPQIEFEHVTTTFPATANQDHVVATVLRPENPENISWRVVDIEFLSAPAAAPVIYRDSSTTRRLWQPGSIVLRCNVASVKCTLELFIIRTKTNA